jgi:hypothetical protein
MSGSGGYGDSGCIFAVTGSMAVSMIDIAPLRNEMAADRAAVTDPVPA